MSFLWPSALGLLLAVPFVGWLYLRADRRSATSSSKAARLGQGPQTSEQRSKRRHLPAALGIVSVALLLFGLARPQAAVSVPQRSSTVVLAFDTSSSMLADDLDPTRLDAAKAAARAFVERQPDVVDLAVVSFGTGGSVTSRPTDDRVATLAAIDRLQPEGGTSIAQGLFAALSTIAKEPIVVEGETLPDVDFGGFGSALVVMFSDGEDTSDQDPTAVTELAARAGIKVITIGIGTEEGTVIDVDGFSLATRLNTDALIALADATNGEYLEAESVDELAAATESLERELELVEEQRELTAALGVAALVVASLAGGLNLAWSGRLP